MGESDAVAELEKLVMVISHPSSRRKFAKNAEETLAEAGVRLDALPEGLVDAFAELTPRELRFVSHLNATLLAAGFKAPNRDSVSIV